MTHDVPSPLTAEHISDGCYEVEQLLYFQKHVSHMLGLLHEMALENGTLEPRFVGLIALLDDAVRLQAESKIDQATSFLSQLNMQAFRETDVFREAEHAAQS